MVSNPIYVPRGRAKEYGDYAVNIYTGCPHRCYYCFAPDVLHKDRKEFHENVRPRDGIAEAVEKQVRKAGICGSTVHLCFTCDPLPIGYDHQAAYEVIKVLREYGNHVQILTKNWLDSETLIRKHLVCGDSYGVTIDGNDSVTHGVGGVNQFLRPLGLARYCEIKTWVSCEPICNADAILELIRNDSCREVIDLWKFGKLNHVGIISRDTDHWKRVGKKIEDYAQDYQIDYVIKEDLRRDMQS